MCVRERGGKPRRTKGVMRVGDANVEDLTADFVG